MNLPWRTIGRYLFAIPFLIFGLFHFMNASQMAGMVPLPGGVIWIYLTGVAHILAAVSILLQKYTHLAGILLGIMLLIFVLSVHLPTVLNPPDEMAMQNAMSQMLKDTALAGGAFLVASLYSRPNIRP